MIHFEPSLKLGLLTLPSCILGIQLIAPPARAVIVAQTSHLAAVDNTDPSEQLFCLSP